MNEAERRDSRMYPQRPLVGVGAVVLHQGHVLLVKRSRPPRLHMWTFPGGAVEIGETVFEAARRELEEETGIQAEPVNVVDVYEVIDRDEAGQVRYHYVIVEVLLRYEGGQPTARDDAEDARWWPIRALDAAEVGPGIKEIVEKALRQAGSG